MQQMERVVHNSGFHALEDMAERACGAAALVVAADSTGMYPRLEGRAAAISAECVKLTTAYRKIPDASLGGAADPELFSVRSWTPCTASVCATEVG